MQFSFFTPEDIVAIGDLQPDGWPDITDAFRKYLAWEFCYPVKAVKDGRIVGLGTYILFKKTGWLAHIIVHKNYRNRGIGSQIVEYLMQSLSERSIHTILLIATELGEPVYKKADFRIVTDYISLKREHPWEKIPISKNIKPYNQQYYSEILKLDSRISGENREALIGEHLDTSNLYIENDTVVGIYLPDLGEGAIYANNATAGIELMKTKYANVNETVIPSENRIGIEFLLKDGFVHNGIKGKRMIYGTDIDWKPEGFYSRIGGNFG